VGRQDGVALDSRLESVSVLLIIGLLSTAHNLHLIYIAIHKCQELLLNIDKN